MENLLPIIIGIIFLAYRQYKKTTKNKPVAVNSENTQSNSTSFYRTFENIEEKVDEFMEKIYDDEEDNEQLASSQLYEQNEFVNTDYNEEMENTNIQIDSVEPDPYTIHSDRKKSQFKMIKNKTAFQMENIDFELRRSVIYDAILNPPYIKI